MSALKGALNSRKSGKAKAVPMPDDESLLILADPPAPKEDTSLTRPLRDPEPGELGTKPAGPTQQYSVANLRELLARVSKGAVFVNDNLAREDKEFAFHMALLVDLMDDAGVMLTAHLTRLTLEGKTLT